MAASNLLDTKTLTINEILGNGKIYRVPQFQRDYSWEQDQWEDLWNDLININDADEAHYMGSIVLQIIGGSDGEHFWIIDGQQRFTTISLLTLAIIHKIKSLADSSIQTEANTERARILTEDYIGKKDASSLSYSSKLFLNENNDFFYQQRLLKFQKPITYAKLIDSDKLLFDAYQYFQKQINDFFKTETSGEIIASFLRTTVGKLLKFIQITVVDELNAYTVFETLNSRGVDLTSTDLLKNYLFSLVAKSTTDLQAVKEQWKKIINAIGLKEFPIFLRYFLNGQTTLVTKHQLFKSIKKIARTDQDVLDILNKLEYYAYTYTALSNPEDELWKNDKSLKKDINSLILFRVTLCHPLLMVAYEKFDFSELKALIHGVMVISFRYNVIGKMQTNVMETAYNKTANKVFKGAITKATEALNDLKDLYLSDEDFVSYFELKEFDATSQQKKMARYILYKLEAQLPNGIKTDYQIDDGTIEHILPVNLDDYWHTQFKEKDHSLYLYKLGNLTLLEPKLNNREAAQKSFAEKKEVYQKSKYALSRDIKGEEWSIKMIKHRQSSLAKTAKSVWKI